MSDAMSPLKPDWREARQRMTDWWAGKKTDRVPAHVVAPMPGAWPKPDARLPQKFTDPETVFRNLDLRLQSTFWGAEAFPTHDIYLGAMFGCTFFGCEPTFHKGGAWYRSPFRGWEDADRIRFDPGNRWWRLARELTLRSVRRSGGRHLTTVGGIGAAFDLFAEFFGAEKTLLAMLDEPERVKALRDRIIAWGKETYDEVHDQVAAHQEGSIDGMGMWAPGRVRYVQCDLCVTMSPAMFSEFVREEIRAFMDHVDHGIYHLDGHEQIRHLDALLSIESLKVIQYVPVSKLPVPPGGFHRDPMEWIDLFRRIQEAGKKLFIICPPERIRPLLDRISREGVFLSVGCRDVEAARQSIAEIERIGM
ncbi:MAG: hypothetical protein HY321_04730 [Armatimonadetes bacterium]|nr:hypothetical protein [Armatimonadota bacterium]